MTILVNGSKVKTFNFNGGECHVCVDDIDIEDAHEINIVANLGGSDDIISLLLTVDAIRRIVPTIWINLTIPYFPYARQDRVCNEGEAFSLKVMANLINSLECEKVTIYDPHSDVTPALLNNCDVVTMTDIIENTLMFNWIKRSGVRLVSPDAGAEKKIRACAKSLARIEMGLGEVEVVWASKDRDCRTGRITGTRVPDIRMGRDYLILDDICDGGKTFIYLSKELKKKGAKNVYLYVTHGIFAHGLDCLRPHFDHIFCYNPVLFNPKSDEFITMLQET
jgi:ribose-phosphate pyrophosphokinase